MQSAAAQNRIFYALADPSRRAIFESLTRGERAVKDLTARFDKNRSDRATGQCQRDDDTLS